MGFIGTFPVHCCLCLNLGVRRPASTALGGYVVCDDHAFLDAWVLDANDQPNIVATVKRLKRKHGIKTTGGHQL